MSVAVFSTPQACSGLQEADFLANLVAFMLYEYEGTNKNVYLQLLHLVRHRSKIQYPCRSQIEICN